MMTEYGQRLLIDRDIEVAGRVVSNGFPSFSSSDYNGTNTTNTEEEEETDVVALLGEVEQVFGVVSNNNDNLTLPGCYQNHSLISSSHHINTIRFQVVIWNIGHLDVASGSVPMTFRVSLFWNNVPTMGSPSRQSSQHCKRSHSMTSYQMQGRQKATPQRVDSNDTSNATTNSADAVDVPPLSILNVSTFTVIGTPEIDLLDSETRLMRWTCMYRATVIQDRLSVHQFPHDCHSIAIELAILSHRRVGQRWDRRFWRLGLATEDDVRVSRKALQIPYGLVVDHVKIPEFHHRRQPPVQQPHTVYQNGNHHHTGGILPLTKDYGSRHGSDDSSNSVNHGAGLQFQFCSQQDGSFDRRQSVCTIPDVYLRVSLMVLRESGYYDRNIVPLLAFLNVVAAVITLVLDPLNFFFRGLLILNIAFNQMGVRLAVDKHLPSVGYEIRMQRIMNHFFFVLLALILEAGLVYSLREDLGVEKRYLKWVDAVTAFLALFHNGYTVHTYYVHLKRARQQYRQGILEKDPDAGARLSYREPQVV